MDGTQIRNLRRNKGLSLRAFGEQMGVSYERVRQLEAYQYISPEIQERICTAFNVDSADPLFFSAPKKQSPSGNKKDRASREAAERAALKPVRAAYVRKLRTELGISQGALARAIGVGQTAISAWECGRTLVSDEALEQIETALTVIRTQPKERVERRPEQNHSGCRDLIPFITVCRSGLLLNKAVMDKLGSGEFVKVYYMVSERLLVIMAAEKGEKNTQKLYAGTKPTKLNNIEVRKIAEKLLGFNVEDGSYRVEGTWKLDEDNEYWMFDMSKATSSGQEDCLAGTSSSATDLTTENGT